MQPCCRMAIVSHSHDKLNYFFLWRLGNLESFYAERNEFGLWEFSGDSSPMCVAGVHLILP